MDETNQRISSEDAQFKADLVQQKAEILTGKTEFTAEDYENAERHLDEMVESYGSLYAVYHALQAERILGELNFKDEFNRTVESLCHDPEMIKFFSKVQEDIFHDSIKDGNFDAVSFLDQASATIVEFLRRAIVKEPDIENFLKTVDDKTILDKMFDHWIISNRSTIAHQIATELCQTAGSPAPSPIRDINSVQLASIQSFENEYGQLMAAAAGSPPPPPPEGGPEGGDVKPKSQVNERERLQLIATAEDPPPPPPPPSNDPVENYKYVEPENLVDVEWENGDSLHFEFAEEKEDDQGRKRNFYYGYLTYTPRDARGPVTINLSTYVPGKTIIFEGTKGAVTGASIPPELRKQYAGWAQDQRNSDTSTLPYMTALSVKELQAGPESLNLIFHEIGHDYLFGEPQKQLLAREKANLLNGIFGLKKPAQIKTGEIAGIAQYRHEINKIRRQLNFDNPFNPPTQVQQILNRKGPITSEEFYLITSKFPEIARLRSIFHERTTGAFAVRQIRNLKVRMPSVAGALKQEKGNLRFYSKEKDDKRYTTGLK